MCPYIGSKSDYDDKLWQADYAFEQKNWRLALGYYNACYNYAKDNDMSLAYLEMKIEDCREHL